MTTEIALVLGVLGAAIVLFMSERLRADVIALLVLLALFFLRLVTVEEAFSGFSNPAVITVWAIYIISGALFRTGVADFIGQRILSVAGTGEARLVAVIMLTVGAMSAFMNNIGATAVLLPAVLAIARELDRPPSKLLIPLAFGSLLGGVTTLIGTPPNLLVSAALAEAGYRPFGLLDYTPMGLIVMLSSIAYFLILGRHLLPDRGKGTAGHRGYELRDYVSEVLIQADSPLVGHTAVESRFRETYDLNIVGLLRDGRSQFPVRRDERFQAGDRIFVEGKLDDILAIRDVQGLEIEPEATLSDVELGAEDAALVEVVLTAQSPLVGRTLRQTHFRPRYGLTALAIWRQGQEITSKLADTRLRSSDVLLILGRRERVDLLRADPGFLVLEPVAIETRRTRKAPLAVGIFGLALLAVILGWLHISAAAVAAAVLMVLSRAVSMEEAYESIEWRSVFLIAGMLPLGIAMDQSGAARFLADHISGALGFLGPLGIMMGLFILTTIITEFMSNAAAAVLVAPIGIAAAVSLGADPRAFVMGIGIAASTSFVAPVGHQANVLVFGPGGYRFTDFTKVGVPLTLLIWALLLIFLPMIWPLYP